VVAEEGRPLAEVVPSRPLGDRDFAEARVLLNRNFEPVDDITWDQLETMVREEGWTFDRFVAATKSLLKTKTWIASGDQRPRWAIGDWWRVPLTRVYGRRWYIARLQEDLRNRERMGIYIADGGGIVYGWKSEVRDTLPEWVPEKRAIAEVAQSSEPIPQDVVDTLEVMKRAYAAEERVDRLQRDLIDARKEIRELEVMIDRLWDVIETKPRISRSLT